MASIEEQFKIRHRGGEFISFIVILAILGIVTLVGLFYYVRTVENIPEKVRKSVQKIYTRFEMPLEKKKVVKKVEKPKPKEKKKPVPKPKKKLVPIVKPKVVKKIETKAVPTKKVKKEPRKVYGVKKVYSSGLGSGGSMSDAVVGKVGNTINKKYDDVKATKEDLKGPLVSSAAITKSPRFKKRVKPIITEEMKKNSVSGTIKVRVLVDIDGRVKQAKAKNDLGFGSKKAALDAARKMLFTPAMKNGKPVAVWIIIPIKFVKIS